MTYFRFWLQKIALDHNVQSKVSSGQNTTGMRYKVILFSKLFLFKSVLDFCTSTPLLRYSKCAMICVEIKWEGWITLFWAHSVMSQCPAQIKKTEIWYARAEAAEACRRISKHLQEGRLYFLFPISFLSVEGFCHSSTF